MPLNEPDQTATAPQGHVASTDQLGRWVSVRERMPDSDEPVLVYTPQNKHGKVWIDCWSMQREAPVSWSSATIETGYMWDGFEFEEVTHWMPLPSLPSGGCTYPQCACEGPGVDGGCGSALRPNDQLEPPKVGSKRQFGL